MMYIAPQGKDDAILGDEVPNWSKETMMTEEETIETPPLLGASVHINSFVRRQTAESEFSHWTVSDDVILQRIQEAAAVELLAEGKGYTPSYRPDVLAVHITVEPGEFYTGVVALKEGDKLVGEYKARRDGENPRKGLHVQRMQTIVPRREYRKSKAVAVDVILYHHGALVEGNENETECDWEIVSINARITTEPQPIHPMTLMHNHFGSDGGTATHMTPEKFEADLKEAFLYWEDKAMLAPRES